MCPACNSPTRVLESRSAEGGRAIRRRRECTGCARRFTTYERVQAEAPAVVKRSGERQRFDREKLRHSLLRATHKRDVRRADVDALVTRIEGIAAASGGELSATRIGELCLEGLRDLDPGAYLQFAGTLPGEIAELPRIDEDRSVRVAREDLESTPKAASRRGFDE
jgi:transcriptional repressor NrdR